LQCEQSEDAKLISRVQEGRLVGGAEQGGALRGSEGHW